MRISSKRVYLFIGVILLTVVIGLKLLGSHSDSKIIKSPQDNRVYDTLTLANDMKIILVSDLDAHTAAAHMLVGKGSFDEPQDMPGLAHFCEHMLFLGTQKYPEPDSFRNFVQSHGGETNAMTKNESTEYFFHIRPESFADAVERFSDFFVAPLFEKSLVDREINAVDSEYQMHLNEDGWGMMDVSKETANPAHPFSRFSIGNHETLSRDKNKLYKDVVAFYQQHYQPQDMTLVLVGPQSIKELSDLAKHHFNAIPSHKMADSTSTPISTASAKSLPLYDKTQLGSDLMIQSKGDYRELVLAFPMNNKPSHQHKVAGGVLSLLLGYEGEGGLALYLKQKHWISGMQAQYSEMTGSQDGLNISFSLTTEGFKHIEEITAYTYGYISLIKTNGLPTYYFDELKKISHNSFLYNEKSTPESLAANLAESAQKYGDSQLITHQFFMPNDQFPQAEFVAILADVIPDNMRRVVVANDILGEQHSRWFKVPYRMVPFTKNQIAAWTKAPVLSHFALPVKNPFIPENLALKKPPPYICTNPKKIERDNIVLWHHQDAVFEIPKGDVRINLISAQEPSPESHILAMIYAAGLLEHLTAPLYPAAVAGGSFNLDIHSRGLSVYFTGYNDKQDVLILEVLKQARDYRMDETAFGLMKDRAIQQIRNARQTPLYQQAFSELNSMIYHPSWHPDELMEATQKVTLDQVNTYIKNHWEDVQAEALISGNYTEKDANELAMVIANQIPKSQKKADIKMKNKVVSLSKGSLWHHHLRSEDPNHIGVWYVQNQQTDNDTLAKTLLLAKFMEGPFFQQLRVEKQLGYALNVNPYILKKTSGLLFWVQSPQVLPNQLVNEMQQFVKQFQKGFASLSEKELSVQKESLLFELDQPPLSLSEQTDRWWSVIETGEYEFDRREKIIEAVEKITVQDLMVFSRNALNAPTDSGQIFVTTQHEPTQEVVGTQVGSLREFRAQSGYFAS